MTAPHAKLRSLFLVLFVLGAVNFLAAQTVRHPSHLTPSGKGWGNETEIGPEEEQQPIKDAVVSGNGISYHGGPVMKANPVPVYFIWYGNWTNGPHASDSQTTINLLNSLFSSGGIGGSGYERINTTYGDNSGNVSGGLQLTQSTFDNYSHGRSE